MTAGGQSHASQLETSQPTPDAPSTPDSAGKVAVLKTSPQTVLDDIAQAMRLAGAQIVLSPKYPTILKINISWQHYYPACSTTPWQLEGVIKALLDTGHEADGLIPAQNRTVVVDPRVGAANNRHDPVLQRYKLTPVWLFEEGVEWITYEPRQEMIALKDIFPDGITIPKLFLGKNALHLPTMKTHVFTTTTGAMKNAFGGLLRDNRHWCHARIHETLVDLLMIQQEIHPGLFAVMDGTIAGNGAGPRAMEPEVKNYILASADQVAIDAISAKMMGFDPMKLDYIRIAHERGLGVGNPSEIEVLGEDVSDVNWGFRMRETFASRGQKAIYHGPLKRLERFLLRTRIAPWSYVASNLYYNLFWFNIHGRKRVRAAMRTPWGKLFRSY